MNQDFLDSLDSLSLGEQAKNEADLEAVPDENITKLLCIITNAQFSHYVFIIEYPSGEVGHFNCHSIGSKKIHGKLTYMVHLMCVNQKKKGDERCTAIVTLSSTNSRLFDERSSSSTTPYPKFKAIIKIRHFRRNSEFMSVKGP